MKKINGIAVYEEGPREGAAVLLIHGFPFNHRMWEPQVSALSKEFRVISYDVRGHGKSEPGDGQYTIEFFVDDLLAVLDHLQIKEAVLCGLSMGGYIALRAAERHPERFKGLVLCDTKSEPDANEAKIKRSAAVRALKEKGVSAFAPEFLKQVLSDKTLASKSGTVDFLSSVIKENTPAALSGTLIALAARTDTTPALSKIGCPALLLVGEEDKLTPPSAAEAMKQKIPKAELFVIKEAGHISNAENPAEFNQRLLEYLKSL